MRLRTRFETYREQPLTDAQIEFYEELYAFIGTQGGVSEVERRAIRAEALNRVESRPARTARPTLALIDGTAQPLTPFTDHLAAWKERTNLRGKYLDQAVTAIKAFNKAVPCSLETLSARWCKDGWNCG